MAKPTSLQDAATTDLSEEEFEPPMIDDSGIEDGLSQDALRNAPLVTWHEARAHAHSELADYYHSRCRQ